ncbi:hypothetical protein J3R08_003201 [Micromonospora sp. HB375]|uniref:hypothetical protein n=1 Tax=unclassified Micromonospora TaxID=2617518 RepID=UPI001AE97700|nr:MULTISPECIES: hypothetical protein [unclassified Micromonospora]MBP1783351.1 hypothetical protein [Micromonospora sp. HB375]MDH6469000.1 hypothetical protein [Micromonospora sp. H404/HB375]
MSSADNGYQRWAKFLELWRSGEDADSRYLPPLAEDDYPADVWVRLVRRIVEAMATRLNAWERGLLQALLAAQDEFEVARALTQSRGSLTPIRALTGHPGLPADLSRQLRAEVDRQIRSVQRALEETVESAHRVGANDRLVQARLRTFRENAVTEVLVQAPGRRGGWDGWATEPADRPRRRLIVRRHPDRSEE